MGWANELYHVYELASKDSPDGLLPESHSTANAQIEVLIDENGVFKGAQSIEKENAVTIIPVTEDSGARSSGITPMPFADKLIYIAGDYSDYTEGKHKDNSAYYYAYMRQLEDWSTSAWGHPSVTAVCCYLEKGTLMKDLVSSGVLAIDFQSGRLLPKCKIANIAQEDAFVRFVVLYKDLSHESNTWLDKSLYNSFIEYNSHKMEKYGLCYATGEEKPITYKHPSKIRDSGDKAKLISSNDESGFSYRGRFAGKDEALSVSYEFSQKMHNALKWLIRKQRRKYGSLTFVTWASALEHYPDKLGDAIDAEWDEEESYDSLPAYKEKLHRYLLGYQQQFSPHTKIMIMGLDAATTGRLSIALYDELPGAEFIHNVETWNEMSAWYRFDYKKRMNLVKSFSLYEIVRAAYGTEQNGRLECDDKLYREQMLRLLPCTVLGKRVPNDLVTALYNKSSHPLSYESRGNHSFVIEVTCGMVRAQKKGEIPMGYAPQETDRSYLYGCLLAIADKAESDTYEESDRSKRVTNARRYWVNFAQNPYRTWQNMEERLRPYLDRHPYRVQIEKWIQEITEKFTPESFADNSRLETLYLLGYHHFMAYMYNNNKKEEND